ncbi:MAG: ATP synthase F0 subunit C [Opitutales bacterium]
MLDILAQAATPETAQAAAGISGSLASAVGAFGGAIAVGLIGYKACESVGRNPSAAAKVQTLAIIAMALAEGIAILSLFVG